MKYAALVFTVVVLNAADRSLPHTFTAAAKRNGHAQTFWPNGRLKSDVTYRNDAYEGEYRTWYASGAPYELRHYVGGHEQGVQQSWTERGELYLNYEVRNGRRYGLVNATPCDTVGETADDRTGSRGSAALLERDTSQDVGVARLPRASGARDTLPYYDDPHHTPRWLPVAHRIRAAENHTLRRQTGDPIAENDLRGRIHVASFIYTSCAAVCPILIRQLARVEQATNALIVSYSVTPETDTPGALSAFGRAHGIDPSRWWLVTGDKAQIYSLARTSYFADDNRADGAAFLHTEKILLVDADGRLRGVYNGTQPREIDLLIEDIRRLHG
jgi:protein SCO1